MVVERPIGHAGIGPDPHHRRLDWASGRLEVYGTPERVGSFGFVAGSERLVTAFASGVALYDVAGKTVDWIARPPEIVAGVRFNDGRVDRR